ncbi:DUF4192 domain-containing protein [uncultured Cellulomonas sp.]|uniref:DUF4192 domain-containing protein n=1 Tax=uncultured Cellulomonas sp. TaxID=189682 RepID=UPI00260BC712|nr:DUF4192 domain-containing protein [uncultured Cellulomonas sp.]
MSQVIRVNEARELLALIPHNLGFTPTDSLVVVSLRAPSGRVGLIARIDLAHAFEAARTLTAHLIADGATRAVVVAYTGDEDAARAAAYAVTDHTAAAGLEHAGTFHVTDTTYRLLDTDTPAFPVSDFDSTVIAATLVSHGSTYRTSRDDLGVTPAPDADRATAAAARDGYDLFRPAALTEWRRTRSDMMCHLATGILPGATPQVAGRLAAALTDVTVRDAILCDIAGGREVADALVTDAADTAAVAAVLAKIIDPTNGVAPDLIASDGHRMLLTYIAAHTDSAPAFTLLANLAWWHGAGAEANVHLHRALTIDPDYRLAQTLGQMLDLGLAPGWIRRQ